MEEIFVSIIVPAFNCSATIERTIQCLINQEYRDYEIIIIDDGSTDNTSKICKKYANNKSVKYFLKQNGGVSSARNLGIKYAKGNYITFVDSDDYISSDFLKTLTYSVNSNSNQLIIADIEKVKSLEYKNLQRKEILNSIKKIGKDEFHKEIPDLFNGGYLNYLHGKLYNKSLILNNNIVFPVNVSLGEDTIFNFQYIINCDEIIMTAKVVYFYINGNDTPSLSTRFDRNLFEKLYNLNKSLSFILYSNNFDMKNFEKIFDARLVTATVASLKSINKSDCDLKLGMQYRYITEIRNKWKNMNLKSENYPKDISSIYIYILNVKSNLLALILLKLIIIRSRSIFLTQKS